MSETAPRRRDATQLHRDAVAIHDLLQSLAPEDHTTRDRLRAARLAVRTEAAARWRELGHRSITDPR